MSTPPSDVPPRFPPPVLRHVMLRVDRGAAVGFAVLAVLALVVVGGLTLHSRPHTVTVSGDGSPVGGPATVTPTSAMPGAGPSPSATSLVVDVVGRVRHPGLVRVPPGSRVWDVVRAAGGFRRASDASSVNLAQPVADGQQVAVGVAGAAGPIGGGSGAGTPAGPPAPVPLNTATLEQLETLPGVGPVLAQRIIDRRTQQGPFRSVDELREVSGIGDRKYASIAPLVTV